MREIGQITVNTDRGKSIIDIIKNNNIKTIVEIGTWKGGGTTTCVLENINNEIDFISIETNEEFYNEAKNNLSEYINKYEKFKLLHGRIVEMKDVAKFFNSIDLNSHPEVTSDQHLNWFLEDFHNFNKCENILNKIPSEIDLLILDGGEYSTHIEWQLLKDKSKIVVLDDITMVKTKSIYDELNKNSEYDCLRHIGYEGNGFAIFKKKEKNNIQSVVLKNIPQPTISQEKLISKIEPKKYKNGIITATNSPYYESLLGLINSVHKFGYDLIDNITVYDIGLTDDEVKYLNNLSKVTVIQFSEAEKMFHPEFLVGKSHVYKNYCLYHSSKFINNVLWIDSGACFINKFDEIFDKIYNEDIFFVGDIHINKDYIHNECIDIMKATDEELMSNQLWSGLVGFKSDGKYQELINLSSMYSLIPNCCNGDHQNHRHDQTILSILSHRFNCPQHEIDKYGYWTDLGRNLETALNYGSIVFAHRRGYIDKSNLISKSEESNVISTKTNNDVIKTDSLKIKLVDENLGSQSGLSRYISPETNWVRDINEKDYDIAIHTDRLCFHTSLDETKDNYAWIIEPPIINGENYSNIVKDKDKFKNVFTHIRNFINDDNPNFVYIPHGGTWLREEDINIHDKSKLVSFIFSDKEWNPYHRMRRRVWDRLNEDSRIGFYGQGCNNPIEFKIDSLKDYMFSIVIENSVEDLYFTEKIIDCFLTGTIPIYVGSKQITELFDGNGIIFFDGDENLPSILETLSNELYTSKLDSINKNFELAKNYIHPEKLIINFITNNN